MAVEKFLRDMRMSFSMACKVVVEKSGDIVPCSEEYQYSTLRA